MFIEELCSLKGRINRMTYFKFVLIGNLFSWGLVALAAWLGGPSDVLGAILAGSLTLFWPMIAMIVKRLHDIDMSGWGAIAAFIPLLNLILGIGLLFAPGTSGPNAYGNEPVKGQPAASGVLQTHSA